MSTVRRVTAADLAALSAAFPESPGTPGNRHARRLRRQRAGLYTYWDRNGNPHRDEELYCYLVKEL